MSETLTRSNQITHIDPMPVLGNVGNEKLENILMDVDQDFDSPMRIYASATPDSKLYISANKILSSDGGERSVPPIKKLIPDFPASTIDFQTGITTGGTVDITMPATTIGQFRRVGLTLISGATLKAIFSDPAASLAAVQDPGTLFVSGGVQCGWIDLEATASTSFKTAGSVANVIENSVSGVSTIHRIAAGGGVGTSGSGGAGITPADGFKSVFTDFFSDFPNSAASKVRDAETNAAFDVARELYVIHCDKSVTVTTVAMNYTLSSAPSFIVAPGDIIYANGTWRKVDTVLTPTTGTIDAAFTVNLTASACMVSQAVWTMDLVNFGDAGQKTRLRDFFGATNINQLNITYNDSLVANDDVADYVDAARVVVSASNSGLMVSSGLPLSDTFTDIYTRPVAPNQNSNYILKSNSNKERCFLVFFCNPNNASVTTIANALDYKCSLYEKTILLNGGILNSAYCYTDSSGVAISATPSVVGGKTRITLGWQYVLGLNPAGTDGEIEVKVEGKEIPRYYVGVTQAYYKEIDFQTIELDTNYSTFPVSVHIRRRYGSLDTSNVNGMKLNSFCGAIVGSPTQLSLGLATHTSISSAISGVSDGGRIFILPGTYTENVTVSKRVNIFGAGYDSVLSGTLSLSVGTSDFSSVKDIRISGNVSILGSYIHMNGFYINSPSVLNDLGISNAIIGISI
jgi:hypothetical protein